MEERYKYLAARLGSLKEKRAPFEAVWDKAAELCALNSAIYTVSNDGRIIRNIFDSTGRTALTSFAASMKSLIAPSNTRYHRLKASNPAMAGNDNATRYLEYATDLCFKFRYQADSRFSSESDLLFNSLGVFGHDVFLTDDNPGRGIYYRSIPVREAFIDTNRHNLVDVVYREFCLTARDAVREFGKDTPAKIVREYERDPASKRAFTFVHCVEPREEFNPRYKDSYNMPVASYTICRDEDMLISESGYRVMPYAVPRYMIRDNSPYGDSPAMQAFYDILTANEMGKTFLRAGQLQANPGLLTSMDNGAARAGQPGAVVKGGLDGNGRPRVVPMQYGNLKERGQEGALMPDYRDGVFEAAVFVAVGQYAADDGDGSFGTQGGARHAAGADERAHYVGVAECGGAERTGYHRVLRAFGRCSGRAGV